MASTEPTPFPDTIACCGGAGCEDIAVYFDVIHTADDGQVVRVPLCHACLVKADSEGLDYEVRLSGRLQR